MLAYAIRRILLMIPTFIGILIINFAVLRLQGPTLVEQMQASACFKGSEGKLGCISCHNPHEWPQPEKRCRCCINLPPRVSWWRAADITREADRARVVAPPPPAR